jgi:hypothetical protein
MGVVSTYTIQGVQIAYYKFSSVGSEKFGYVGSGEGDTSLVQNGLNQEIDTLITLANNPEYTSQQKLDFYEEAISVMTDVVGDLQVHYQYWAGRWNCCQGSGNPLKRCIKKCNHSRKMIGWVEDVAYSVYRSYQKKLEQLIGLLEQTQQGLETDLNNQQLVADTNIQIAQANQLLLAVQLFETEVREQKVESNIRIVIFPLLAIGILATLYYNAFIKK